MSRKKKTDEAAGSSDVQIIPQSITKEMQGSFIAYAMSVITSRALPDVRDGLKPVHRRILYSMLGLGLSSSAKFKKSATIVGDVLGKYHPHGDTSVYDAMVGLAQSFSTRYPLVIGQGNFGSVDGDPAAAYRYTEAKMSKIAEELMRDIDKDTVDFRPNFDDTQQEPSVLPAAVPSLLLNGALGIAVGMATNIPPHNLNELINATVHLIDKPDATTEDLLEYVQGPDFPTGGIVYGSKDLAQAYASGRGGVVVRGEAEITEDKKGKESIVISSLPYRTNRAAFLMKIADLVHDKKLQGIKDIRDESTDETRIVIDLKSGVTPQRVLNYLYKHTELETKFNFNMVALVDGVPETLSLKDMLGHFITHREEVVRRRSEYDLAKAKAREHILEGLTKALDQIDAIIQTIKKSKDTPEARLNLIKKFKFTEIQAQAILDMRLQKLAGLERKKIEDELAEVRKIIAYLESLLKSVAKMRKVIVDELTEAKERYGDERKTKVLKRGAKSISDEDLVPDKEFALVFTAGGYVKRTDPGEFKKQKRGGVGVVDLDTKEEDVVTHLMTANAKSDILFFTDAGKVYQIKMYELPEGKRATRGKSINNYLQLTSDEHVTSILAMPRNGEATKAHVMLSTRSGIVKKVAAKHFEQVRKNGLIAINLAAGDELFSVRLVEKGDDMVMVTAKGQSIRFHESDVRAMGRTAGGVRGIKCGKDDYVVGATVVRSMYTDPKLLVMSELGYGKMTPMVEYKVQKRGGSGIKTANTTGKTGLLVSAKITANEDSELIAISKKSQVIRTELDEVSVLGRATQGVRIMKLRSGDKIASLTLL